MLYILEDGNDYVLYEDGKEVCRESALSTDSSGHEHKGKGEGGGQFIGKPEGETVAKTSKVRLKEVFGSRRAAEAAMEKLKRDRPETSNHRIVKRILNPGAAGSSPGWQIAFTKPAEN